MTTLRTIIRPGFLLTWLWPLWLAIALTSARGSELVAIDDAGGMSPAPITSLDLYDNGLYWSVFGGNCFGEFSAHSSLAYMGFRWSPYAAEHYITLGCSPVNVGGAVRDDTFAFYTTPDTGVQRKPLNAGPSDPSFTVGKIWYATPGAMMIHNGRVYYSFYFAGNSSVGWFAIEYFNLPGDRGIAEPTTEVSNGLGGLPNVGRIRKLDVVYRRASASSFTLVPHGLALTEYGYLLRFNLEQASPQFRPAAIIATSVSDFVVRREEFFDPIRFSYEEDTLYASVGVSKCPSDPPSRLITVDPFTGASSTVYTSIDGYINAIAADEQYLFVSAYGRQQLGGPFGGCDIFGSGVIRSKCSPANLFVACTGADPNWDAIEFGAGENLRSDDHFLYFTRGKQVRRLPNNAPPIRHDFAALGLEAVQVIQDLDNSVRLIQDKRTVVRAYARVADSTLTRSNWFPSAELRGFHNGVELAGPLPPIDNARITTDGDFNNLRPDGTRSFNFELPGDWVRSGQLTLRFTVNPNLALYESGGSPLGNNTVEVANIPVVELAPPCLVFCSVETGETTTIPDEIRVHPLYWPSDHPDEFARILERAKAMLPVADFRIHLSTERIDHEGINIEECFNFIPCAVVINRPFFWQNNSYYDGDRVPSEAIDVLEELKCYHSFDQARNRCSRVHYVGMVYPTIGNSRHPGVASAPGNHLALSMNARPYEIGFAPSNVVPFDSPAGGVALAQLVGRNYGRRFVTADPLYPFDPAAFDNQDLNRRATAVGFDMVNFTPVAPSNAGDLMSAAEKLWPSAYTYNAILNALGPTGPAMASVAEAVSPAPPPGPYLLLRGELNLLHSIVHLKPCYTLTDDIADPGNVQRSLGAAAAQPPHGYVIRKLNAAGAILGETPLVIGELDGANDGLATLNQFITKPAGMAVLQVWKQGRLLAECRATPHAPIITSVIATYEPAILHVSVNASDADGDAIRLSSQFSNDDGASWQTLRVNEGNFSFAARMLPGGARCRVRVLATDGFHTALATSEAIALPPQPPEPFIGGVLPGERLPFGTTRSLIGLAPDAEDGSVPGSALSWLLTGPTPSSGPGSSLALHGLSPGTYVAELRATDSHNNTRVVTNRFEILPLTVPENEAPLVDGDASDSAYANATVVRWSRDGRVAARFVHSGGNLYISFSDLAYRNATPATVGLRLHPNASGNSTPQSNDVGFFVDDTGTPFQLIGNGTSMQVNSSPPSGFKAVITRGAGGWNAEFRIADGLLGGWDHAAAIVLEHNFLPFDDSPLDSLWPHLALRDNPSSWAPAWFGASLPTPTNLPPVAVAKGTRHTDLSSLSTVALDGSGSFDPEGGALTYAWTQVGGPNVSLEGATTPTPTFAFHPTSPVTLQFRLVVNDGQTDSAASDVEVDLRPAIAQTTTLPPAAQRNQDGSVTVSVQWSGRAGDLVRIQASTDLHLWEDIGTNLVDSLQQVVFTDARTGIYRHRFYRLAGSSLPTQSIGNALQFDGGDDAVEVPHQNNLNAFPLTLVFWLKTVDTGSLARGLVSKYADNSGNGYALLLSQGRVRGWYFRDWSNYIWDGNLGLDSGFVADGQWHHIALVVDAMRGRLYVDGFLRSSLSWVGAAGAASASEPLQFGHYFNYPVALNGQLDEIALWNRALSETEINLMIPGKLTGTEAGLVGFWPLDTVSGDTAADISGFGHTGTLRNGPQWLASSAPLRPNPAARSALRFDGVDDAVQVPHQTEFNAFPLSIAGWVRTAQNSPGYVSVLNKYPAGSANGYSLHIHNGRLAAFYFRGDGVSYIYAGDPGLDGGFIADGQWHHVAYVVDSNGGRIYVDGIQTGSLGWTGTPGPCFTTAVVSIGLYPFPGQNLSLNGRIDELTLWNRALDAMEINAAMRFKRTGIEPGLIGFWPFDNGSGPTATDATGHGYNGVLQNGPLWVPSDAPLFP